MINVTSQPLYTRERDPVHTAQETGWPSGPVWTGTENLVPIGIRFSDLPECSDSLYEAVLYTPVFHLGTPD